MSILHEYIALRATTYLLFVSKKINYLCLDKGTEGKHKHNVCLAQNLPLISGFKNKT